MVEFSRRLGERKGQMDGLGRIAAGPGGRPEGKEGGHDQAGRILQMDKARHCVVKFVAVGRTDRQIQVSIPVEITHR